MARAAFGPRCEEDVRSARDGGKEFGYGQIDGPGLAQEATASGSSPSQSRAASALDHAAGGRAARRSQAPAARRIVSKPRRLFPPSTEALDRTRPDCIEHRQLLRQGAGVL